MYPVSNAFMAAVESNARKYYWHGTIDTIGGRHYTFTEDDIVKGSGYITRQCCGSNEIELGTVYSAEMGITLFSDIDRYTLEDAVVKLYFTLELADGSEETIPMGIFEVSEANRKINCLELKGYDYMLRFEKSFSITDSSGTAYHYLTTACAACDVEFAHTKAQVDALPNGTMTLGVYTDNDIETYRDLLYYTSQVLGCLCQINREGKLELIYYGDEPVADIPTRHRYTSSYSDFVTRYTAVSSTNMVSETSEYYALEVDDGLTMNLGVNPLLQFGLKSTREKLLRNVLNCLAKINYVPFDSTTIGNPAFDPGDIVTCSGGHADSSKISCITSITYNIGGKHNLKCVGKNPRLAHAKSKNEKNIMGLLNQVEAGKTVVYSFMNASPLTIGNAPTEILDITFVAKEETSASFFAEILLTITAPEVIRTLEGTTTTTDAEGNEVTSAVSFSLTEKQMPNLKVIYELNDEEVETFYPTQTCVDGKMILTLFFPIPRVIANSENTITVLLEMDSGSASIGASQIRATVSGQGLAAGVADWNGRIKLEEVFSPFGVSFFTATLKGMADSVVPTQPDIMRLDYITAFPYLSATFTPMEIVSINERVTVDEVVKTFTVDKEFLPAYNEEFVNLTYLGVFSRITSYTVESEVAEISSGSLEHLFVDTSRYESVTSLGVRKC